MMARRFSESKDMEEEARRGEGGGRGRAAVAPLVAEKLRVHASARLMLLAQSALDAVLVSLVALVVRGVVLRLGHFS